LGGCTFYVIITGVKCAILRKNWRIDCIHLNLLAPKNLNILNNLDFIVLLLANVVKVCGIDTSKWKAN